MIKPRLDTLLERQLALRLRTGGREARPPDQLLLPQPRRGDIRRVPAADGRDDVQELPQIKEIAAGKIKYEYRGQDARAPAPWPGSSGYPAGSPRTRRSSWCGSRLRVGHAVRVVQTPASLNFVGRATFAA